jgi:hypothetical protein
VGGPLGRAQISSSLLPGMTLLFLFRLSTADELLGFPNLVRLRLIFYPLSALFGLVRCFMRDLFTSQLQNVTPMLRPRKKH